MPVALTHPVQHQLLAGCEMQREPVPAALILCQRLAAPFPVHPGETADLDRLVVDGETAFRLEEGLAVIIGGLLSLRLPAVAAVALQHQWMIGLELQRAGEV